MKPFPKDDYVATHSFLVAQAIFRGTVGGYSTPDTLSTWVLGATGLAVGFLFSNFEKLSNFLKPAAVIWVFWLFVVSVAAGLVQKYYAMRAEFFCKGFDAISTQVMAQVSVNLSYTEIETIVQTALTEFKDGTPWPFSNKVQEAINGSKEVSEILKFYLADPAEQSRDVPSCVRKS